MENTAMNLNSNPSYSWKSVNSLEQAKSFVDYGVILHWQDAKRLTRKLSADDRKELIQHFAVRIAEENETRLVDEVLLESCLNLLAQASDEKLLLAFLESLLIQPGRANACLKLVEIALTIQLADDEHDDIVFSTAVSLVCELGLAIDDIEKKYPGELERSKEILAHIATYLLSVSNTNNTRVRLSLINYFGMIEHGAAVKNGFNKVMSRFGHTVLDYLFHLLFRKKSEAVALQYLIENLPYILQADRHGQKIIHETWKCYMLKNPERFGLFLRTFSEQLKERPYEELAVVLPIFFQHLGALLRAVSEVNHKSLIQVILSCYGFFDGYSERDDIIDTLLELPDLRKNVRELLRDMRRAEDSRKVVESAARFLDTKRGRKPSFTRVDGWLTINQVNFLGSQPQQESFSKTS